MASDSVYVACVDAISQGDIVSELPWGAIDSPLIVCRPDVQLRKGEVCYGEVSEVSRAFNRKGHGGKEFVHAKAGRGPGIVLWHTCEVADYDRRGDSRRAVVGVAPIFSMADRLPDAADQLPVRELRRTAMFPLPPLDVDGEHLGESYVDFRWIWSVKQSLLARRLAGLSASYLELMYSHLERFFTRRHLLPEHPARPT